MNLNFLQKVGGPAFQKALLKASKYAPEILTGVGIAATIGGTVLIAKASTKVEPVMLDYQDRRADLKQYKDDPEYTTYSKDLTKTYARQTLDLGKLYGPGISLSVGGIISILAAHGIMKKRIVVLTGAYKAVEGAFAAYRARVIEEFGEDTDRDFRLGIRTEKIEDPETGKKKTVRTLDPNHISQYARIFDEGNPNWKKDPEYNLMFVKNMQNWANDKLRIQGYLFLNEVYDMLGFERSQQGQLVGWVMDPNNGGDLHVDFNLYYAENRDFINGLERSVLLDFNVDGVILDLI